MRGLAAAISILGGCLASHAADVAPAIPVVQERYVQAQTTNVLDQIPVFGFGPFDEFIVVSEQQATTSVRSSARQRSELYGELIKARGESTVTAETVLGDPVLGQGVSSVDYSFLVLWQCDYTLVCKMTAQGQLEEFPAAAIRLTDPSGARIIDEAVNPGESMQFVEVDALVPGTYRLQVISRSTVILGLFPEVADADSRFSMILAPGENCLADLDDDGMVGATDLNALLGAWESDPDGPPDFNYDGTVNTLDANFLLLRWGECPD